MSMWSLLCSSYLNALPFLRLPGGGARGKTSLRWTTRSWAVACVTTTTRTSSIRQRASAMCTASSATCRVCWATHPRSSMPCWTSNLMPTSEPDKPDCAEDAFVPFWRFSGTFLFLLFFGFCFLNFKERLKIWPLEGEGWLKDSRFLLKLTKLGLETRSGTVVWKCSVEFGGRNSESWGKPEKCSSLFCLFVCFKPSS